MSAVARDAKRLPASGDTFDARLATEAELRLAAGQPEWRLQMTQSSIEHALARGEQCFAVFDRQTIASVGWFARHPAPVEPGVAMDFDPSWVYMHRSYTATSYRGRHLHGLGTCAALEHYTRHGARGLVAFVEFNNLQSLRSMRRVGFRQFGWIGLWNFRKTPRTWASPGCRAYQFRLVLQDPQPHGVVSSQLV
jgi:hypothetical protein